MPIHIENPEENQFDTVQNLLNQQDEVILQLDELNVEIESLIDQLAKERNAELGIEDDSDSETNELESMAPSKSRRAA
jgi:low affinity Fe/Cu permease